MTKSAKILVASCPLLLLVRFVQVLLPETTFVGYRWLGEFALAAFLLVSLLVAVFDRSFRFCKIAKGELITVVLPLILFTVWSGLSFFWASSWRSAMHHTLLWGCFTVFYVLLRSAFQNKHCLSYCLKITGFVVLIISAACLLEFFLSPRSGFVTFVVRYYPYAEILACLLPLTLVIAINGTTRQWITGMIFNLMTWCSVVIIASRTMFVAGAVSILMTAGMSIALHWHSARVKRWLVFIGLALAIIVGSQMLLKSDQERALLQRFAGTDTTNVQNARLRLFYWGMAVEGFKTSPVAGIGADNYFSDYKMLREKYSAANRDNPMLEVIEELLAERAHNEYLQILCELGLVGGLLLAWLLTGIAYMLILAIRKRASFVTLGALVGTITFLLSSFASSYSFRVPANGLCFFFLIAVAATELFKAESVDHDDTAKDRRKPLFLLVGLLVSISMLGFSAVRALSIHHLTNSLGTLDTEYAEAEIKQAIGLDASEPLFRSVHGQQLFLAGRYEEAIPELRLAIENGVASSPSYFNLLSAEMRAGKPDANITFEEAMRVYPRSIFLRTAYAAFLKRQGDAPAADVEYKRAFEINQKLARSWQLAHDEGLERLSIVANADPDFIKPMDLIPADGALALVSFQR